MLFRLSRAPAVLSGVTAVPCTACLMRFINHLITRAFYRLWNPMTILSTGNRAKIRCFMEKSSGVLFSGCVQEQYIVVIRALLFHCHI